jgi:hypothetical protein
MNRRGFYKDLNFSLQQDEFWLEVYSTFFPNYSSLAPCTDNRQKKGVDRIIYWGGRTIFAEEKNRREFYPDIFLEYKHISLDKKRTWDGWITRQGSLTEYFFYGILPLKICFVFYYPALQKAWEIYKDDWFQRYKPKPSNQNNEGYTTWSLPIPIKELKNCLDSDMYILNLGDNQ